VRAVSRHGETVTVILSDAGRSREANRSRPFAVIVEQTLRAHTVRVIHLYLRSFRCKTAHSSAGERAVNSNYTALCLLADIYAFRVHPIAHVAPSDYYSALPLSSPFSRAISGLKAGDAIPVFRITLAVARTTPLVRENGAE